MAISVEDYLIEPPDTADRERGRTLADVFGAAVEANGSAPAVLGLGEPRSWTRWRAESRALAAGLRNLGISVGDVVAVHLQNSWEFLLTHIAVAEVGAVLLPLHMAYGEADLLTLMRRAQARLLVLPAQRGLGRLVSEVASLEHVLVVGEPAGEPVPGVGSFTALVRDHRDAFVPDAPSTPELPLIVLPTSGTVSGRPNLCLHSHATLLSNAMRVACDRRARGDDVIVSASPFTHLFGLLSVHLALLTSSRQALLPRWDAAGFHDLAERTGASVLFAVPAQLRDLAQRLDTEGVGLLRLREVRAGGAAVPGSLVADVRRLTGASTIVQWGMSELGAGTVTQPDDPPETAVCSIGRPLSGSSARVVDDTGRSCPAGQVGELQYRGPHLFHGYLDDPELTRAAFTADGWLRTGELVVRNADGTIGYQGRYAEVINVGGQKFSATEIEGLLSDLPQLAAAAVAARSDDRLGQYPCLIAVLRPDTDIDLRTIRAHLIAKGTAEFKLPLELILVDEVPLTPTGKIARGRLPELLARHGADQASRAQLRRAKLTALPEAERIHAALTMVREQLADLVAASGESTEDRPFRELGVDSLGAVRLAVELSEATGLVLPTTVVFDHPTPELLARWLAVVATGPDGNRSHHRTEPLHRSEPTTDDPIVIVGMACRLPGGIRSPEELWRLLADGRETVGPFPTDRGWDLDRLRHPDPTRPGRSSTCHGHFLAEAAEFDAQFFGISPREALAMDPQQRLLLETSWEALERAGLDPTALRGSDTGVFVGQMSSDYAPRVSEAPEQFDGLLVTGNAASVASGRISYTLGLNGPALTVDTACSSSLVALHLAVAAMRRGECSLALAAGATVMATPASFVDFSRQGALAPDGRCKAFAAAADGAAWAEGVGVLVLERLSLARRQEHPILAVIAGSAVNQDGASNGLTAPNGLAQQRVLRQALADAGVTADRIDVIEAHGTGTPLGDRIEAEALREVYGTDHSPERPLWLGSIKSNIGHTQAAAGFAGVIKIVLAMRNGELPRTLHTDPPSPALTGDNSVRLLTDPRPWTRSSRIRRAGVSAFGISGTNAHVILQEPPAPQPSADHTADPERTAPAVLPWVLSARSAPALRELATRLLPVAEAVADPVQAGRALAGSRPSFEHRAAVIARDRTDLLTGLRSLADGRPCTNVVTGKARPERRSVFVFPGHGAQWERMAAELLDESDVFARTLAECDRALAPHVDWSVRGVLCDETGQPPLDRIEVTQTSLFAVMVALAELWRSFGVCPNAVVGHSQGEIVAAYVCGALSLDDAAMLSARRAAAVAELAGGRMAAVALPREELAGYLAGYHGRLWPAADNGPRSTAVSGAAEAVAALIDELGGHGIRATTVAIKFASHSAEMEAIEDRLVQSLSGLQPRTAEVPFFSTVFPGPLDTTRLSARYWYQNVRCPVEFHGAVRALLDAGYTDFIEASPHPVLIDSILETAASTGRRATAQGTLRRHEGGERRFLLSAAEAYANGIPVAWPAVFTGPSAGHVELPCYPFQRERYWLPAGSGSSVGRPESDLPATTERPAGLTTDQDSESTLLALIREHAAVVLGHPDGTSIDPDETFAALGTSSMASVELSTRLSRALDLAVPATMVLDGTPRVLAAHLRQLGSDQTRPTFASVHGAGATRVRAADLALEKFIDTATLAEAPTRPHVTGEPHTVLLTGANGYLGRFLALEWLQRLSKTGGKLICIVRGSDHDTARTRLEAVFADTDPTLRREFDDVAAEHLEVIAGDIGEPNLGLEKANWDRLARSVDLIVHSAALVNHILPYEHLFGPNVVGTAEVIRLAVTERIKPVAYLSTAAVAMPIAPDDFLEDGDIRVVRPVRAIDETYANGYANSKWAGEVLLREAHDLSGVPVAVFRSDQILAHSRFVGQVNVPDSFTRLVLSLLATGIAPWSFYQVDTAGGRPRAHYDGLPADFVAESVATLGAQTTVGFRSFDVMNPHDDGVSLDTFVDWLLGAGHDIARIDDYDDWLVRFETALEALPEKQRQHSVLPLLSAYREPQPPLLGAPAPTELFRAAVHEAQIGASNDISHISAELINKYVSDLHHLGLLLQ
jgi:thioester reductase-like protein